MIPKIIQIVSFLLYATPPNHFMPLLHLSSSRSHFITITTTTTSYFSSMIMFAEVAMTASVKWSPRHVDTKLGVVQGFIVYPNNFDGVEIFYSLPYAMPPVGNLRFMPPVSGSPWSGVRRTERPSPVCPQVLPDIRNETELNKGRLTQLRRLIPYLRNQSEDCLYLNLYVPLSVAEGKVQEKLPVLVFIQGDAFGWGSGNSYDPKMLVSIEKIIVVTLNYRLGILGFLNANSDSHFRLPYNFSVLDLIGALQWVQESIALFGGDKTRVTIFGHSKGAVLVNLLMISPAVPTGILFQKVILSSGSALSPLTSDLSKGLELSKKFANRVRCPSSPSSAMVECLREVPVRQFLESELWSLFGPSGDGIVVKNELPPDSVITQRVSHYPLLFGVVKQETLPELSNQDAVYGMENERRRELLKLFINKHYRFHLSEMLSGSIFEYTDWQKPIESPSSIRDLTLDALADAQVVAPLTKVGDLHSQSSRGSKAWFYVFDYQSKSSDYQQRLGCPRGEELVFILGTALYFYENDSTQTEMMRSDISGGSSRVEDSLGNNRKSKGQRPEELGFFTGNFTWYEVQLSLTTMRLFANFVRIGNPNGDPSPKSQVIGEQFFQPLGKVEGETGDRTRGESGTGRSHHTSKSATSTGSVTDGNRFGRENLQKQQQEQLPEPIFVEWPQYDHDKKYLVLDLRPRVKSHYRSHPLSFWIYLVPAYQRNDEGTSITSIHHHGIFFSHNNNSNNTDNSSNQNSQPHSPKTVENLSKVSVIPNPTVFASGLYDLSQGSGIVSQPHNSSVSSNSPKLSLGGAPRGGGIDPDPKEQQDSGEGESTNSNIEETVFGFHAYQTALSVTIAIGCSLLILNILIFATFYYEREKRLNALRRSSSSHSQTQQRDQSFVNPRQQSTQSSSSSLKRRKENGGIGMPLVEATSFYMQQTSPDNRSGNERSNSNVFNDLNLSAYVDEEPPCGSTTPAAASTTAIRLGEVSYGNYPIKRYSEIPVVVGSSLRSGSSNISRNRSRRSINELAMSIDMSAESLTNDPNFSSQSSAHRTLEIGTAFVGIESSYHHMQDHHCHFLQQQDNSSIEDGQSSPCGSDTR